MQYASDSEYVALLTERKQLKARIDAEDTQMKYRAMQVRQAEQIALNRLLDATRHLPEEAYDEKADPEYQSHKAQLNAARVRLSEVERELAAYNGTNQEG